MRPARQRTETRTAGVDRNEGRPATASVHVVTACDEPYLPYVAVMIYSLAACRAESTVIHLTILQSGVSRAARSRLELIAGGVTLHWIDVEASAYRDLGAVPPDLIQRPHYFRCLVGALLPSAVQRCIYLDADTLVRSDLLDLWRIDLDRAVVGAALDYFLPRLGDAIAPWRELELDPEARYFNSGVMLIDLDAWRSKDVGSRALRTCIRHESHLMAQGKWPQHDQFGLNAALQGAWRRIPQEWNYLSEMPPSDPRIVHYCGGGKPGFGNCQPLFTGWFQEALRRTGWPAASAAETATPAANVGRPRLGRNS